ncbi:hypothetical protein BJ165DRAFT_1592200 [Panaeolus papilionaceus]|nr:hypothetical protein BJ165DRAFT_1592200 [Panaeolus papilionaceus]
MSNHDSKVPTPFNFGQKLGLFFTVLAACLSAVSVTAILAFFILKWIRRRWHVFRNRGWRNDTDATDSSLFVNLMLADLIQAIALFPNVKWMINGEISIGALCTTQAVLKHIGIVGVSLTSLMIAIHTFVVLVLRWRVSRLASALMVFAIWVSVAIIVGIPNIVHRNATYYGEAGYWCWIHDAFPTERIVAHYLWIWLASFSMILLYGAMFLVLRRSTVEEDDKTKTIARSLLYACRWASNQGATVPYQLVLAANAIFQLSGALNLLLFLGTRPGLVVGSTATGASNEAARPRDVVKSAPAYGLLPDVHSSTTVSPDLEKYSPQPFETSSNLNILSERELVSTPVSQHASVGAFGSRNSQLFVPAESRHMQQKRSYGSLSEAEDQGYLAG